MSKQPHYHHVGGGEFGVMIYAAKNVGETCKVRVQKKNGGVDVVWVEVMDSDGERSLCRVTATESRSRPAGYRPRETAAERMARQEAEAEDMGDYSHWG